MRMKHSLIVLGVAVLAGNSVAGETFVKVDETTEMESLLSHGPSKMSKPTTQAATQQAENETAPQSFLEWDHATGDWFGARKALSDFGIDVEPSILIDWSKDLHGGRSPGGSAFRHLFSVPVKFDLEKMFTIPGSSVFMSFLNQNGEPGSNDVGDIQGVGAWDANGRTELAELWYQQKLADDLFRIKLGKIDANIDFAYLEQSADFVNGSVGWPLSCAMLPTYPDPAMGGLIFVYPTPWLYMGTGVFDGALAQKIPTGERGPTTLFGKPSDLFFIGEAGAKWQNGDDHLSSRFFLGGWGHTGRFTKFDGSSEHGTTGFYMGLDQQLWKKNPADENDNRGIAGFFQYDHTQGSELPVDHHLTGGLVWTGPIPSRDTDTLGASVAWAHFTDQPAAGFTRDGEVNLELFYKLRITQAISVQPDLQYIFNPGGKGLADATVGTLRVQIAF